MRSSDKGEKVRMNGLEITMELLHFGVFSLVQQPVFLLHTSCKDGENMV